MANFTALKTAINNAIKTNGNEEITGAILQAILDAMVETLGDSAINDLENAITMEVINRENAVGGVADDLAAEALARANKDNQLDGRINHEEYNRQNADAALSRTVDQGFQTLNSQMTALNAAISALNAAYQNGYLYGGIATPSSSPSNNKCFYIALQGGTYTNFGGVGVVEGINIIKNDSGWKVEHIYDQTTLLNEFYLLRQQVIRALASYEPIVVYGDVTNAPDEEDLTSNAQHLLKFKDRDYSPLNFSGLGMKILRKNILPLNDSVAFNGFLEGVTAEETLAGSPELIFWDRINSRFVGIKDGIYYAAWTDDDNYVPVSTSLVYMYNGTPYQWTGSDFIVDETEVPNLVNCLTQDMINEANTIYIIRYDYTLKENITIPANCVLEFDGGSISGEHTITGQNTGIEAGLVKIFNTDVILAGSWNIAWAYPEWFGAVGDGTTDDTIALQKVVNFVRGDRSLKVIRLSKAYAVRTIEIDSFGVHISGAKKESNVGLIGIEQNAPVFHITGMARGFNFENFTITGTVSGVIGIYAEAICTERGTAGMWHSRFDSLCFTNCYTAIKLRAMDSDIPNVGNDVANQFLTFSNIRTNNIAYADIHVTGQLGQTYFNECSFENGTRQCYILIDGNSSTNDGFYANFNNCSFPANPSISVVYADNTLGCVAKFNNCWFEDISNPFIRSKTPAFFEFNNCFWTRCNGTNFITDSNSNMTVEIKGGYPFGSEYQNAGDTYSMNSLCYTIRCDNNFIKSFYRASTSINEVGEFVEVLAKYKMTTIERVRNAIRYNRTYSVYLGKHSEYNYSITGIKDGNNFIGYFTLGKTYLFEYKLGKLFCTSNTILSGTSQDRTEVIDTSLISAGFKFFDTTLNKELWWNGSSWVDNKGFSPALTKGTYANRPVGIHTESDVTVGNLDRTKDIGFEYFDTDYGFMVFASAIAVDGTVTWDSPNFDSEVGVAVWSNNKMFFYPMNEAINHINEALGVYVRSDNTLLIVAKDGSDYKKWNTTNVAGGTSYKSNLIAALDDNDGVTNTTTIINTLGNTAEAATYCNGYEPSNAPAEPGSNWASKGLGTGKWHLGSVGEFSVITKKIDAVNKMLAMIGGTPLFVSGNGIKIYWTSTEYNAERTWAIDILTNNPEHPNKIGNYNVRPICRYNIT